MVKITGTLHIDTGFVRLKPNINFIGAKLGLSVYDLSKPLEIELNPTPAEGLYLVDYTIDINSGFLPTEHWFIPNKDCTFDEIRGIKKLTTIEETQDAKLAQITEKAESIDSRVNSSLDILKRFS